MRWFWVALVVVVSALCLYGVRGYTPDADVTDEIRAVEVAPERSAEFLIPGGTEQVFVGSWCMIPSGVDYDPGARYDYRVRVQIYDVKGRRVLERTLEFTTRISGDPTLPLSDGKFAARLLEGEEWVGDPRSSVIDTRALKGRSGRIKVEAIEGKYSRVLLRLAHPEPRSEIERQIVERALSLKERRRLVSDRAALGFFDLSQQARIAALSGWGRRLTAIGREGTNYVTRSLLLGDYRRGSSVASTEASGIPVGPEQPAVFNFVEPLVLSVQAPAGTRLLVNDGSAAAIEAVVGPSGQADLDLKQTAPRTVIVRASTATNARFSVTEPAARQQLGDAPQVVQGGTVVIEPDVRVQYYFDLSYADPVVYTIAPGQPVLGLGLRVPAKVGTASGTVRLEWRGAKAQTNVVRVSGLLEGPGLDSVDSVPVSDVRPMLLRPPPGATELRLTGTPELLVTAWTHEPGVNEWVLLPGYDVDLPPELVWRNAPYSLRPVAPVRADNHENLLAMGRLRRVRTQVSLEALHEGRGRRIAERVALPLGHPRSRRLFTRARHGRGAPFPRNGWTRITDVPSAITAPDRGANAGQLEILYRADREALGRTFRVLVDAETSYAGRWLFGTGTLNVPVPPGVRRVALVGLGEAGVAYVRAAPSPGGIFYKEQKVFELRANRSLSFRFRRNAGELLSLYVFCASDDTPRSFELGYTIDPGRLEPRVGELLRRLTEFSGKLSGRTGGFGQVYLWDAGPGAAPNDNPDQLERMRVPLGDDLKPGWHDIRLDGAAGATLWCRAAVAGRVLDEPEASP